MEDVSIVSAGVLMKLLSDQRQRLGRDMSSSAFALREDQR